MKLYEIAHSRTGDKGDISNISVIAYDTTQDPSSVPYKLWEAMGYDKEYAANQLRLQKAMNDLEELPTWSCTPYYQGNTPRIRQNVAWAESSAVSYGNSVLGCRTNRTPAGLRSVRL